MPSIHSSGGGAGKASLRSNSRLGSWTFPELTPTQRRLITSVTSRPKKAICACNGTPLENMYDGDYLGPDGTRFGGAENVLGRRVP